MMRSVRRIFISLDESMMMMMAQTKLIHISIIRMNGKRFRGFDYGTDARNNPRCVYRLYTRKTFLLRVPEMEHSNLIVLSSHNNNFSSSKSS